MGCGTSRGVTDESTSPPACLKIGELLFDAEDEFRRGNCDRAYGLLDEAHSELNKVPVKDHDTYSIMLNSREGCIHLSAGNSSKAIEAFSKAIALAEVKISERCKGLHQMLQRYTDCLVDVAGIWEGQADKISSKKDQLREYGKCEMALLRAIETVEEGHNRRSDLLVRPIQALAALYEKLEFFSRSELLLRRCQGIIIVQYGHEHPGLVALNVKLERVGAKKEEASVVSSAVKLQSVARMRKAMSYIGRRLDKKMKRHELIPPASQADRDQGEFLSRTCQELAPGSAAGHKVDASGAPVESGQRSSIDDPMKISKIKRTTSGALLSGSDRVGSLGRPGGGSFLAATAAALPPIVGAAATA